MKNKIPALCAVLLLLLALSVCGCGANVSGSDASTASEPEELVLTDDSGLKVTVLGSEISVSAPADETIGYAWEYTIRDERLISCTYNSLDDETADRKLQGFTFKAQRPGRTVIELTTRTSPLRRSSCDPVRDGSYAGVGTVLTPAWGQSLRRCGDSPHNVEGTVLVHIKKTVLV